MSTTSPGSPSTGARRARRGTRGRTSSSHCDSETRTANSAPKLSIYLSYVTFSYFTLSGIGSRAPSGGSAFSACGGPPDGDAAMAPLALPPPL
eukprot:scaffold72493_cov45-Phaeocystis_antarctica.AAC.1